MTQPVSSSSATSRWRTAFLLFGPPALWAMARSWLDWQGGRDGSPDVFALSAVPVQPTAWALLLPGLLTLLGVLLAAGLLALWWRRGGAAAVKRVLAGLWTLVWLAGTLALFVAQKNLEQLGTKVATVSEAQARVLGTRPRSASLRQPGGSELMLQVQGLEGVQQVQISDRAAAQLQPGDALALRWAAGRYYGRYLVAWTPAETANPANPANPGARLP